MFGRRLGLFGSSIILILERVREYSILLVGLVWWLRL